MAETTEVWTYRGADWDGDKIAHCYTTQGGVRSFKRALTMQSPGAMFTMTLNDEGLVYYKGRSSPTYIKMNPDVDRAALEAKHKSALAEGRMAKQAKADMAESELQRLLGPISVEYGRRNHIGKAALLGVVIEIITARR